MVVVTKVRLVSFILIRNRNRIFMLFRTSRELLMWTFLNNVRCNIKTTSWNKLLKMTPTSNRYNDITLYLALLWGLRHRSLPNRL